MNKDTFSYKLLLVLCFLAIYLIWGTTYLAIVIGLEGFPPFLMASVRFLVAGVLLVGYSLIKREQLPTASSLLKNAVIGLIVLVGGQGLLIWAEQYIASGYASVLVATLPVWFVVVDRRHWKLYFSNPFIITGVMVGFVGIIILFWDKINDPLSSDNLQIQLIASGAVILGAICWVLGTVFNRSYPAPGTIYHNLGWQLLAGSVFSWLISTVAGETLDGTWSAIGWRAWSAVLYLSIAGSVIAYVAYTWLLNQKPSAIVGTYAYINPVVAVFLGWWLANEQINSLQMAGMIVVLISAIVINLNKPKPK